MQTYTIRVRAENPSPLPGGWPERGLPEKVIRADFATRAEALDWYGSVRGSTVRQQVTLYGPKGNRMREALGTANDA